MLNVAGNFSPGATPAVPTPSGSAVSGMTFAQVLQNSQWQQQAHQTSPTGAGGHSTSSSNLSQSAPATTGSLWGAHGAGLGLVNPTTVTSASGTWVGAYTPAAGAQHVTGMMGAAILDEVDEGDEAFGEGSEIMGD